MKIIKPVQPGIVRCCAAFAIAGLMSLSLPAQAQEKGATQLIKLNPIKTVADAEAVQPGDTIVMSCPKCKDSWVTVVEKPVKTGTSPREVTTVRHECPGCQNKIVSAGQGKQTAAKIVHTCKNCGSNDAFCCVMKKGSGPTQGMEKK